MAMKEYLRERRRSMNGWGATATAANGTRNSGGSGGTLMAALMSGNGNGAASNGSNGVAGNRMLLQGSASSLMSAAGRDQQQQEEWLSDEFCSSDELDKLSMCLSEASSSENHLDRGRPSLLSDIVQAQLALWTLVGTVFYSYVWQQHRKKFLVSLFVVIPPVLVICCTLSSLLTAIVILGRVFSSPLRFQDILQMDGEMVVGDESDGSAGAYGSIGGGSGSGMVRRRRTVSGTSCHSCHGIAARALSMSCDELPKPMCRKHSTSKSSTLSLYGSSANNGSAAGGAIISNGIIGAYGTSNGAIPGNITPAAVRAAADSIGGIGGGAAGGMGMGGGMGGMPVPGMVGVQPRLSHQYSHYPSEGIVDT